MRLWHYKLIPVLPKDMLVSQWRECIAIKRQWEKGTLKHRLVSYVMDHEKMFYFAYMTIVANEMLRRNIKFQQKYADEIAMFCLNEPTLKIPAYCLYSEHNDRYFAQCYYNLEEKHDRGIISDEEWQPIEELWCNYIIGDAANG